MKRSGFLSSTISLAVFASLISSASAVVVTYTLVPDLSMLTLSGDISGLAFQAQKSGSMVDFFTGTITGNLVGGVLTFSEGSVITGGANPAGPFVPATNGFTVENYGFSIPSIAATAAFRNLVIDMEGGTAQDGVASRAVVFFKGGVMDYDTPPTSSGGFGVGQIPYLNAGGRNSSVGLVSITTFEGIETLSIPVVFSATISTPSVISTFTGTLVATRAVPEPASIAFSLAGLGLALVRRRK